MKINIKYFGQLREYAGVESEKTAVPEDGSLNTCLKELAGRYEERFANIIFDDEGSIRPSLMIVVNGSPADKGNPPALAGGDEITLLAAIAGG